MKHIGGNTNADLQEKTGAVKNEIGEKVPSWTTVHQLKGFLDYSAGETKYSSYNSKIQESTHVFICDYVDIGALSAERSRLIINGEMYDVILIDDPMNLHYQLEFYLRYTGGQNGN